MSEMIGSGDNGSQLLENEQILLDWSELPSHDEMMRPAGVEAPAEDSEEDLSIEVEKKERLTAQARGDRLLRAAAESLPQEEVVAPVETEVVVADGEGSKTVDTVVLRAQQALGREKFGELTNGLLELSYVKEPDEVMKEFRAEAEKVGSIEAGDLWEAVLHNAKVERFGQNLADVKFYYSTSFEDLQEILQSGKLKRKDDEGSPLKSDLKFSCDYMEDGEWKSGFAEERGAKSQDVTMVFDMGLLLEDSFVALGKNPSASTVEWWKSCRGLVTSAENYAKVRRIANACGGGVLPVYLDQSARGDGASIWTTEAFSAGALRDAQGKYIDEVQRAHKLSEMVYEGGADDLIETHLKKVGERITERDLRGFLEKYRDVSDMTERKKMVEELAEYYGEVFGITNPIEMGYWNEPSSANKAVCALLPDGRVRIKINEAYLENMTAKEALVTMGHESCHGYQKTQSWAYVNGSLTQTGEQRRYGELCHYGSVNYIDAEVDVVGYYSQFTEREAFAFGDAIKERYDRLEAQMNRPAERAKRAAKKAGEKIMSIGRRGEKRG